MLRLRRGRCPRLLDVLGLRVDQADLISARRQPAGIDSSTAAGVNERSWSRRQMTENQLLRTRLLELKPSAAQAGSFVDFFIVAKNLVRGNVVAHRTDRIPGGHSTGRA